MPQLLVKPLSWFIENPQVRKTFLEEELIRLGESLMAKQLQPLLCQPTGVIIAGARRYRAALLVGLQTLEVKIADEVLDETKIKIWQYEENTQRANLTAFEQVSGLAEIARLNPAWTGKELAANLHMSPADVSRFLTIAKCPIALRALESGEAKGVMPAYAIAKAPEDQKAGLLALRAPANATGETKPAASDPKPKTDTPKLDRVVHQLSGTSSVKITATGKELTLDGYIKALSDALEAARKSKREQLDLRTAAAVWAKKAEKS